MSNILPIKLEQKYKYVKDIGSGKNGKVILLRDPNNERLYALKSINTEAKNQIKAADDIRKEIEFLLKANHRSLPRVYEFNNMADEEPWMVMSYHPGVTFEEFSKNENGLPLNEAMFVILELLHVVEYLHIYRGTHCDLHPKNIMMSYDIYQHGIMLIDFGSGHIWSDTGTHTHEGGDFRYKSPQIQADHRNIVLRGGSRDDHWRREDFSALGHLLGKMKNVFISNASKLQKIEYEELCKDMTSGAVDSVDVVRSRLTSVFFPYNAIEQNADLLGHSDEYVNSIPLPLSGKIKLSEQIWSIVGSKEFQKLKQIKQLSFCEWAFPSSNHTRFEHSLGVFNVMQQMIDTLGRTKTFRKYYDSTAVQALLIASLLHDVGHYPFSHVIEQFASSRFYDNDIIKNKVSHSIHSISMLESVHPFGKLCRTLFNPTIIEYAQKIIENKAGPLSAILDGAIDIDKIDYLRRDSYHCGLSYGLGNNIDQLIQSFRIHPDGKTIVFIEQGMPAIEGFLLLQNQMLTDVYWNELSRSIFAQIQTIFVMLFWSGRKGLMDDKKFTNIIDKIKSTSSEQLAIDDILKFELDKKFPSIWKRKYPDNWKQLQKRGLELLDTIKTPNDTLAYRCIDEFSNNDPVPDNPQARTNIWQTLYNNPNITAINEAIIWANVTKLRASYKSAISKYIQLDDWELLEVLIDVPYGKAPHKVINIQKKNGDIRSISNMTHLQTSIFNNPTRFNSVIRVYISPQLFDKIKGRINEIRLAAETTYFSEKLQDGFV